MTKKLTFNAIAPQQSPDSQVAFFVATAQQIDQIASINRLARDENGLPTGFQRPQIAKHIREIGDYLARPDAILANPIVLGFVAGTGATIKTAKDGSKQLIVDISKGVPGQIVDGQQRFSALREIGRADFQVPVSAFICSSHEELTQQFILINNTKPLNKGMIYELLPNRQPVWHAFPPGLPPRCIEPCRDAQLRQKFVFEGHDPWTDHTSRCDPGHRDAETDHELDVRRCAAYVPK